jgi:hypothetical protein
MDACGHDGAGPDRRDGAGRVCGSRTWAEGGGQPACGYARHAAARSCRCHRAAQGWARGPTEERERRVGRWVSAAARVRRPAAGGPQASRRAGLIARGANRSVACLVGYSYTTFRRLLRRRRDCPHHPGGVRPAGARARQGARGGRPLSVELARYRKRNLAARAIARLKQHRAVATRYEAGGQLPHVANAGRSAAVAARMSRHTGPEEGDQVGSHPIPRL